jgi:hypothetical protein
MVACLLETEKFALFANIEAFTVSPITYHWTVVTVPLILDHSYLVGNLTNSKIAETKAENL